MIDNKKNKISLEEKIILVIVSSIFLITQNAGLTILTMIISFTISTFIIKYMKDKKFEKKSNKISKYLFYCAIILSLIDAIITNTEVNIKKTAIELNPIVNWIWSISGVVLGEMIRITFIAILFHLIYRKFTYGNKKQKLTANILIFFIFLIWLFVVVWNIIQILK